VQPMVRRTHALELIAGVDSDRQFGPVILFGAGGTAVEVLDDTALTLPPLNLKLARDLIARTRISRLMRGYRKVPAVALDAVALTLVRLSQMVIDLPEIEELDINPLLADADGVVALDARIRVRADAGADRLAIRPYPKELEEAFEDAAGRRLVLRPILPEDEPALRAVFARLTPEEVRFRFFVPLKMLDHLMAARFTQIDYDRQMALVLTEPGIPGTRDIHGVVRLIEDPNRERAEFAIFVERSLAGQGLGKRLVQHIIDYARTRGIGEIWGEVLADNHRMLTLCREFGFAETRALLEPGVVRVALQLRGV
jgi:acetyltransferase